MFIGRKNELNKLNRYYESSRFEMLIVYGRRRVVKYRNEKIGVTVYDKLIERSNLISKEKMYYYIFSKGGFTTELQQIAAIKENMKLITFDELFKVED